jgi:hypothetical protein
MKLFKSKFLKLFFVFLIIQSLHLTPVQAISCKDAKKTASTISSKIIALEKERELNLNKIDALQKPKVITKKEAATYTATCLKMFKNYSGPMNVKAYCDHSKDIGETTWVCSTKVCSDLLARNPYLMSKISDLKYDVSKVITNSQKCFSAMEVLNAQKELRYQGRS